MWISGDTVLYDGVREVAERIEVGTAIVHLGSVHFPITGPVKYTMTAKDAIELCELLRPHTVVPVHYEGWSHFKQGRQPIEHELEGAPVDQSNRWIWHRSATHSASTSDVVNLPGSCSSADPGPSKFAVGSR